MGVDWASKTHHVVVIDARGRKTAERGFPYDGEGMAETAAWIGEHTDVPPAAVPVACAMMAAGTACNANLASEPAG